MNGKLFWVIVVIIVGAGGWYWYQQDAQPPVAQVPADQTETGEPVGTAVPMQVTVTIEDGRFTPATVAVASGGIVTWVNQSSQESWPASAMHPTHTVYPGSDIDKCGTDEEAAIFDACGGISMSGSYEFTFSEEGVWRYHDHLNASMTGTVIVE